MSDTHPQATESTTEPSRWDMIRDEIERDVPTPALPPWLATVISAIAAILPGVVGADAAFEALRTLLAPLTQDTRWMALPDTDPGKIAARAAKDAKLAEINALRAPKPQQRQAVPVIQASAPVPLASLMPQPQAVSASVPVAAPQAAPLGVVLIGEWRQHQVGNEKVWHALMPLAPNTRAPRAGDIIAVARRNGHRENKRVTKLVISNQHGHLVAVESTRELPTYRTGISAPQHADTTAALAAISPATPFDSAPVNSELATEDSALASELAGMQAESTHNASTQSSGSLADGTMRGVGFSTAQGYVTALANGVKRATADGYIATLRNAHGYTSEQIAALTVTIIPEAAPLPVGTGITHKPTGPSIFDLPRAQRAFRVGSQPQTQAGRATVRELQSAARATLNQSGLIAGLMTERALLQWSWTGGGERKRERFVDTFEAQGISTDLVPPAPSAERSCGHAVETLKGRDYDTKRLTNTDLPEGVKARWQVGHTLSGAAVTAGAEYGRISLVVNLHDDGSLSFDGDAALAAQVRGRYNAITSGEILKSDVLTAWLGRILAKRFYAVKDGAAWYVPAGMRDEALAFYNAVRAVGWGSHRSIRVTDEADVASVLSDGLRAALTRVSTLVTEAIDECRERARAKLVKDESERNRVPSEQALTLAAQRATLTTTKAATLIKETAVLASRISGYESAMGEEAARELRQGLIAVQRALEAVAGDDTTARAAMLELE